MEKIVLFLLALCVCTLAGTVDQVLVNGTLGATPIWTRTSPLTQPAPVPYASLEVVNGEHSATMSPVLYWGNSFVIKNVRPQNDTLSRRKRLTASHHFAIQNQSIAMDGQEYLIRPRGIVRYKTYIESGLKRGVVMSEQLPENGLFDVDNDIAVLALNVTPKWSAFRLTNTSDPATEAVAFFDSETIKSDGATFTFWASNPSASIWWEPGAIGYNISDPDAGAHPPTALVDIQWLVACRWIANGTDCGDDFAEWSGELCTLVEDGLCWSRSEAPDLAYYESFDPDSNIDIISRGEMTTLRKGDWSVWVTGRPLSLWEPSQQFRIPHYDDTILDKVTSFVKPNQNSPVYVVGLPLSEDAQSDPFEDCGAFAEQGTSLNECLRRFMPGRDNVGGTLEISVRTIIAFPPTSLSATVAPRVVTHIQMMPPKVVISREQPTASFYFTNLTRPADIASYQIYFQVVETSPSTVVIANTSAFIGTPRGVYPNGAYAINTLLLKLEPFDFELRNFPPNGDGGNIEMPISPEDLFDCDAASNAYVAQLATSAAAMNQSSISVPFNITPPGSLKFWSCSPSSGGGKRQSGPTQLTSFTFIGSANTVLFYVTTQPTPAYDVSVSFGTPVLSNAVLLDPIGGFNFAQNGTYKFNIIKNSVEIAVTNSDGLDQTGGPFFNQDFYVQFKWTPPTPNGFRLAVSALYTSFPPNSVVSNNGTTGTFVVPPGSSGFLAGPFQVNDASARLTVQPEVLFGVTLLPNTGNASSDDTWYRLPLSVLAIPIYRSLFAMVSPAEIAGDTVKLLLTGQKSMPICIGPAFPGALKATDEYWINLIRESGAEWLILEPVGPRPATKSAPSLPSPSALVLTGASPVACFTARYDVNWQYFDIQKSTTTLSHIIMGGPDAGAYYGDPDIRRLVDFQYEAAPAPHIQLARSAYAEQFNDILYDEDQEGFYVAGETVLMWVTLDTLPPRGLDYTLQHRGATVTPVSPGAGSFSPTGPLQQLWRVTFDVLPVSEDEPDHSGATPLESYNFTISMTLAGPDALFYISPDDISPSVDVHVLPRLYEISMPEEMNVYVGIPAPMAAWITVRLLQPVVSELTVTPSSHGLLGAAESSGIRFTPSSFTFTPTTDSIAMFAYEADNIGYNEVHVRVSGKDQNIFREWLVGEEECDGCAGYASSFNQKTMPLSSSIRNAPTLSLPDIVRPYMTYTDCGISFYQVAGSENLTLSLYLGPNFIVTPDTFDLADGKNQNFSLLWTPPIDEPIHLDPLNPDYSNDKVRVDVKLTGSDAWMFAKPESVLLAVGPLRYEVVLSDVSHVVGVRYTGYARLLDTVGQGLQLFLLSPVVSFYQPGAAAPSNPPALPFVINFTPDGSSVIYFEYVINVPVTQASKRDNIDEMVTNEDNPLVVNWVPNPSFAANHLFDSRPREWELLVRRRAFIFDTTNYVVNDDRKSIGNPFNADSAPIFMVNRESPLYTIVLTAPPANSVTLTLSHPNLVFNGGEASATLVFSPGQLSHTFSFTPTSLPRVWQMDSSSGGVGAGVNIQVSGPDAEFFEYYEIQQAFEQFVILPELGFTPIPAVPTDGAVSGLKVWLNDALENGFPYSADNQFILGVVPVWTPPSAIVVEPSIFSFSRQSLAGNRLSQEFAITHVRPSFFNGAASYRLRWNLVLNRFSVTGSLHQIEYDITSFVPLDARTVILQRYSVHPLMPSKLNFDWQSASFNLTRAPAAYITLIPHGPREDGVYDLPARRRAVAAPDATYSGALTAGGRIVFDPATIVFAPGQQVAHFRMKAIPGSDQKAVYYRVQWEMSGHADDLENFLDWVYGGSDGSEVRSHFATWHVAPASSALAALSMVLAGVLLALLF